MNIREMKTEDIDACADILRSVYNNELWQCRWSKETAIEYLTDIFQMQKFVGYVLEEDGVIHKREGLGRHYTFNQQIYAGTEILQEEWFCGL